MNRITDLDKAISAIETATDTGQVVFNAVSDTLGDAYGGSQSAPELMGVYVAILEASGGPLLRAACLLGLSDKDAEKLVESTIYDMRKLAGDRIGEALGRSK